MKSRSSLLIAAAVLSFGLLPVSADSSAGAWAQLYSPDPTLYAANLRAAGCPEETVGLLVSQEMNRIYADKERALQPAVTAADALRDFWAPERREAWLALQKEKLQALRTILGTTPGERAQADWVTRWYPRLTREQAEKVRLISEDYDQVGQRVVIGARGTLLDQDRDMLEFLEREREKDLAEVLTDDEVVDYQIRRSRFGAYLRMTLESFEPTPEELRTCYQLGVKYGLAGDVLGYNPDRRHDIQQAMEAELARRWAPPRFAEYQRSQSMYYRRTYGLVRRLGQPRAVADRIFDSQIAMGEAAMRIARTPPPRITLTTSANESGSPPGPAEIRALAAQYRGQRTEQINQLLDQHIALVTTLLGDDGLKAYYETHQMWIDRMRAGSAIAFTSSGFRMNAVQDAPPPPP